MLDGVERFPTVRHAVFLDGKCYPTWKIHDLSRTMGVFMYSRTLLDYFIPLESKDHAHRKSDSHFGGKFSKSHVSCKYLRTTGLIWNTRLIIYVSHIKSNNYASFINALKTF